MQGRVGIVMAGGQGTRLHPATMCMNKHLIPVYDKPMIYYAISLLLITGIREIIIITNPEFISSYERMFADSGDYGLHVVCVPQARSEGIAQAFLLAEDILNGRDSCLVLGDNILFGSGLSKTLRRAAGQSGATIFSYPVNDPTRFGVVELDQVGRPVALVEKPVKPKSNLAVPGIYFYDSRVVGLAKSLKPSERNELEITDVNRLYMQTGDLTVEPLGRGIAWMDTGTFESLLDAANFVAAVERRQGFKIGCLEEIAWRNGWISLEDLRRIAVSMPFGSYRDYLESLQSLETDHHSW